jgi:cell division protein FtsB
MPSDPQSQSSKRVGSKKKSAPKAQDARSGSLGLDAVHTVARSEAGTWSRVMRWGFRLGVIVGLAWVIGYLPLQFFGERGLAQYRRLKRERGELSVRNQQLAGQIRQMKLEVERLREDDVFLEKAAREDLGMVRKGELVFVIEEK